MTRHARFAGLAFGLLALAACDTAPRTSSITTQPVTGPQPTNVGTNAAQGYVPGSARIMGGSGNAEYRAMNTSPGTGAPLVPGSVRIMGGSGNAETARYQTGPGVQAPIVRGSGEIMGGLGNAEVTRMGGGAPAR